MGSGTPGRHSLPSSQAGGQWLCRKSWTCSPFLRCQAVPCHQPHSLSVPWPAPSTTMSPAPAQVPCGMSPTPSKPPAIAPGWSSSQGSMASDILAVIALRRPHGSAAAPWAVRGINAQRRFIFLPLGTLSQHMAQPQSTPAPAPSGCPAPCPCRVPPAQPTLMGTAGARVVF